MLRQAAETVEAQEARVVGRYDRTLQLMSSGAVSEAQVCDCACALRFMSKEQRGR